ncbi:MAG: sensor histidine kinase [Candidatus Aureabacteria bacterium]|nr:sensor histidine kinase [Candidatus Auribacterota bacterium]
MTSDWKLACGFVALLLLILLIGLTGIYQISSFSKQLDNLGRKHFPLQKAALEIRMQTSMYAMYLRNYVFWKSFKYLEAARKSVTAEDINDIKDKSRRQIEYFGSLSSDAAQKDFVLQMSVLQKKLFEIGDQILELADRMDGAESSGKKEEVQNSINKLMMVFETRLFAIDDFIESEVQSYNLRVVEEELEYAREAKRKAYTLLGWSILFSVLIGGQTAVVVYNSRRNDRLKREELTKKIVRIEEKERENLSMQVHDQMGQDLSGLKIYLDIISKVIEKKTPDIEQKIQKCKDVLSGLIEKSHNIAELLRPPALDELGLTDALRGMISQYRQVSGLDISFSGAGSNSGIKGEYSLLIYRIIQECLTNIIKHSGATKVEVSLEGAEHGLELTIKDNGVGFRKSGDGPEDVKSGKDRLKLGLLGVRERVEFFQGSFKLVSLEGTGTTINVKLPLEHDYGAHDNNS